MSSHANFTFFEKKYSNLKLLKNADIDVKVSFLQYVEHNHFCLCKYFKEDMYKVDKY